MQSWTLSKEPTQICNPLCRFFRCAKKALDYRRNPPWCNWVDAPCIGYQCPYAQCNQMKLLPDGRCAIFVKRKTAEDNEPVTPQMIAANKAKKKLDRLGL